MRRRSIQVALLLGALLLAACSVPGGGTTPAPAPAPSPPDLSGTWLGTLTSSPSVFPPPGAVFMDISQSGGGTLAGTASICIAPRTETDSITGSVASAADVRLSFGSFRVHGEYDTTTASILLVGRFSSGSQVNHPIALTLSHGAQEDFQARCALVVGH